MGLQDMPVITQQMLGNVWAGFNGSAPKWQARGIA